MQPLPMAFFYQRQSLEINKYFGNNDWRYYYDHITVPGAQHFIDLSPMSSRDEVFNELENADYYLFAKSYQRLSPEFQKAKL